jgi:uncharacterized protein (TIGR03067 family)
MVRQALVVLAVGLLFAADAKDKDKTDDDRIKGTWLLQTEEQDGNQKQFEGNAITVIFAAEGKGKVKYASGRDDLDLTYQLDATRKPPQITVEGGGHTLNGIYKLDGDTLTICFTKDSTAERPAEFVAKEGDGRVLVVLKREKK